MDSIFLLDNKLDIESYLLRNQNIIYDFIKDSSDKSKFDVLAEIDSILTLANWYCELRIDGKLQSMLSAVIIEDKNVSIIYIIYYCCSKMLKCSLYSPILICCLYENILKKFNNAIIICVSWIKKYLESLEKFRLIKQIPYTQKILNKDFVEILRETFRVSSFYFDKTTGKINDLSLQKPLYEIYFYKVDKNAFSENKYFLKLKNIYNTMFFDKYNNKKTSNNYIEVLISEKTKKNFEELKFKHNIKMHHYRKLISIIAISPNIHIKYVLHQKKYILTFIVYSKKNSSIIDRIYFSFDGTKNDIRKSSFNKLYFKESGYYYIPGKKDPYILTNDIDISDLSNFLNYLEMYLY